MKLLLLHLSDIHFTIDDNYVSTRQADLVRSLRELNSDIDVCIVVVSGDIAQSGAAVEYSVARSFFDQLSDKLRAELHCQVEWVLAPGNHDCVLPESGRVVRATLVGAARENLALAKDDEMLAACTSPQDEFFRFLAEYAPPSEFISRLWYDYKFDVGGCELVMRVLNTAWMSERNETPAKLAYPLDCLPAPVDAGAIAVTVFHHPSNWLSPENARAFRKAVGATSDLVLTGHEHDAGNYVKVDSCGTKSEYVEGAVLQHRGSEVPTGFNTIVLDLAQNTKATAHFTWSSTQYCRTATELEWTRFSRNRIGARKAFDLSDRFAKSLDDPGLQLTISSKSELTLNDIFVWPDFREVSYTKKARPLISGPSFLSRLATEKMVLITGADKSGKTAVCKQLFAHFRANGHIPVFLSCSDDALKPSNVLSIVEKGFATQYSRDDLTAFRQLPPAKRVVIVDDIHRLGITRAAKVQMLDKLREYAQTVILTAEDLAQQIEEIVHSKESRGAALDFMPYAINQFGHLQRFALAEKWFSVNTDPGEARDKFTQAWPDLARVIDAIVGKNFVPSYPVFLLSLLQAHEASRAVDIKASTYGYFFETFIRESLAVTSKQFDPITKREYLGRLARLMYDRRITTISERDLRDFHREHEQRMQLSIEFTPFLADLTNADILSIDGGHVKFKYNYTYYYFVAAHLSDRINEEATRSAIELMCQKLHVEEFANVMLFMAHLSRDRFIVETMLRRAKELYSAFAPAMLSDDIGFVNDESIELQLDYVDNDVVVTRKKLLSTLDEYEIAEFSGRAADVPNTADEPVDEFGPLLTMNTALKTLQILGQILKNFAGALEGDTKLDIAGECYALGLRVLAAALSYLKQNKDAVYTEMFHILRREHAGIKDAALLRRANGAIFQFAEIMSYGIVKRVSSAVGSDKLLLTYETLRERDESPAVGLIDLSLQLAHSGAVPEAAVMAFEHEQFANPLVSCVLRQLVVSHFDLFDVHPSVKQRVCAKLKIGYQVAPTDRREVLIAGRSLKVQRIAAPLAHESQLTRPSGNID
jgi:hypothetical protein